MVGFHSNTPYKQQVIVEPKTIKIIIPIVNKKSERLHDSER